MKVAFLMRSDFEFKRGGDVVQIESYSRELTKIGYQCDIICNLSINDCLKYDVFVLVNIDRPIETIEFWSFLKKNASNKKVYLIPIHHPINSINKFERYSKGLVYSILSFIFPCFYSREKIKNFIRFKGNFKLFFASFKHLTISYKSYIKHIIENADALICISEGEKSSIENDFDVKVINYVIAYNAVERFSLPIKNNPDKKSYDVIVVGRIEQRKNQINIINSLKNTDYSVCFVGAINGNSDKYCISFLSLIRQLRNFTYLGSLTHFETLKMISDSRLLLNASYFEVNPLVDLEACLVGTQVVTTMNSYTQESIPNSVLIDPWDNSDILLKVSTVLDSKINTLLGAKINESWNVPSLMIHRLFMEE